MRATVRQIVFKRNGKVVNHARCWHVATDDGVVCGQPLRPWSSTPGEWKTAFGEVTCLKCLRWS